MKNSDAAGGDSTPLTMKEINSNKYNRETKKMYIKETIKENPTLDLRQIIAKLHNTMGKRTAKEWLEAMEINGEIEFKHENGKYIVRVLK